MTKLFVTAILIFSFSFTYSQGISKEDSILSKLKKINFTKFHGKSVNSFLRKVGEYKDFIPSTEPPRIVRYVIFRLTENVSINISVKNIGKIGDIRKGSLNIKKFSAKKISWICLKYKGDCIKGCAENPHIICD